MSATPGAASLWSIIGPLLAAVPRVAAAVTVAPLFPASLFPTLIRGGLVVSLALKSDSTRYYVYFPVYHFR